MKRLRFSVAVLCVLSSLLAVLAAVPPPSRAGTTPAKAAPTAPSAAPGRSPAALADIEPDPNLPACSRYLVIGVRGSGEGYTGPYRMGERVTPYAAVALSGMPAARTKTHSLLYPASPVSHVVTWNLSVVAGKAQLVADIKAMVAKCPGIRIGLVGYSQGAYVIHLALVSGLDYNTMQSIKQYCCFPTRSARDGSPATPDNSTRYWWTLEGILFPGRPARGTSTASVRSGRAHH